MKRDLETLRNKLWEVFEEAAECHNNYQDCIWPGSSTPFNPKTANRNAMANLAQAITGIETELRLQDEEQSGLRLAGKAKVPANKG